MEKEGKTLRKPRWWQYCFLQRVVIEDLTDASEMVDTDLAEDMNGIIPEEPQEFRHATSLDSALQHLIPTLQSNQGLFILYSEPAFIDA